MKKLYTVKHLDDRLNPVGCTTALFHQMQNE